MTGRRQLTCGLVLLAASFAMLGQNLELHVEKLTQALNLTDAQLAQLQQNTPEERVRRIREDRARRPEPAIPYTREQLVMMSGIEYPWSPRGLAEGVQQQRQILDDSQRSRLDEIASIFVTSRAVGIAIRLGLITEWQWGTGECGYPLNFYGSDNPYWGEFALTPVQIEQFGQIERNGKPLYVLEREYAAHLVPDATPNWDSASSDQARDAIAKMRAQVYAVLNEKQRSAIVEAEAELELANEAIQLGLIPPRPGGEPLCQ